MEEEVAKVLKISELLQRSRPLTGASFLSRSSRSISHLSEPQPSDRFRKPPGPTKPVPPNQNPNPRIVKSLNHPTVIIGTLTLPAHDKPSTSKQTLRCSKTSCFSFSDGSSTVCCDVLDLDVGIIGRKIHVLSWNFIPFKRGSGFLEIISWKLPETSCGDFESSSSSNVFPLSSGYSIDCKDNSNSRYCVYGALESISPVSVVPCAIEPNSTGSRNVCGFLVQILACECKLCRMKDSTVLQHRTGGNSHCFTKPLIVYFSGSASPWHPVISKLIGNVALLSGLKKKLVFIGEDESQLMYVTTEKAVLHLPKSLDRWLPVSKTAIKGKGECGMYTGTVTGIYMQGMVVELDREVLLLLTDQFLSMPHSLRVGAIISVRNVHLVNPKFSWTRILVLGACCKTSINVKSFSPFETGCCINLHSLSLLAKFIDSLTFSLRLWVLLIVSSFRKKFAGMLSDKEILGSKHREGLAQSYATSRLPSSVFRSRHGVFREFCKHDPGGCGNGPDYRPPKLVVPISNFMSHCEATWMKNLLEREMDSVLMYGFDKYSGLSCDGLHCSRSIRRILYSEDISVDLLGCLKISPASGRLQLIDATGNIDVIIPDLPSTWNINSLYEVNDFILVMEAIPEQVDCLGFHHNESFSCRNIFSSVPLLSNINLATYLLCHFRDIKFSNHPFYFCIKNEGNLQELQSGRFHLLLVTHKYPVQHKFQGEQVVSNSSSIFAEAFILPWDLFLAGKDGYTHPTKLSAHLLKESRGDYASKNHQECVPIKRYKFDQASIGDLSSELKHAGYEFCDHANCYSTSSCTESYQKRKCLSSPLEIPCFVTGRCINDQCLPTSGILCCSEANVQVSSGCKPSAQKVLLDFRSESFCKYELLKVGGYYLIKHHEEDMLCNIEDINDFRSHKASITSGTLLWSLSFSSDEVLPNTVLSDLPRFVDSFVSANDALFECPHQNRRLLLRLNLEIPEIQSDICVHISANVATFLKEDLKLLDDSHINPYISLEEVNKLSWCNETTRTGPVQSSGMDPQFHLPEGNLISLHGHVLAVHKSGCSSFAANLRQKGPIDVHWAKLFQVKDSVCIHVLVDRDIVTIFGDLSKHACPIGFGPGIDAIFHRVLVLSGRNEHFLTPTSFIAIKAISVVSGNNTSVASGLCNVASLKHLPSSLIFEIMQHPDCKPVQFYCRVVAVYILVLEKNSKAVYPHSRIQSRSPVFNIPLAGFVLDDGSSSCCCWANHGRAATLLRLQEQMSHEISGRGIKGLKNIRIDEACTPSNHLLERILEKHGRIIVKNYGSMFDSSGQDLTFSVTSDSVFSRSDEDILKLVILNACFSTFWTVVGSPMDSNATGQLEKRLMEMDMTMHHPMQNIWVREAHYTSPLTQGRKIAQELLNS